MSQKFHLEKTTNIVNYWDVIVLVVIFGFIATLAWGSKQMTSPYQLGSQIPISLEITNLPKYATSSVIRMLIALCFSLLFTFTIAPLAAKSRRAEKVILPLLDIMQSIPVLGMLSITVIGFISLFPNSMLGPECAAIFAIFTAQVWNMTLSLYQSLKTVPKDLQEAAQVYKLSGWQKFWRVEVPHGTPGLIWNTMMSMSAGWFFVVLSEAISVTNQTITLPGLGSYIHKAILESNLHAIGYAILTMLVVILLYDQLLFRPILAWAEKFQAEIDDEQPYNESWCYNLLTRTKLMKKINNVFEILVDFFINILGRNTKVLPPTKPNKLFNYLWYLFLTIALLAAVISLATVIYPAITFKEISLVLYLGLITATKVIILIFLASIIWIPIGVWIGLNATARQFFQPVIQFLAAFPANFFYPLVVIVIVNYKLNTNVWTTPLMILGTQWYILFNVIAGVGNIPKEMKLAVSNFKVKGWLWWKRLILPAIFPYYVTGAMTAAGGCWNASIVAEFVQWGDNTLVATGLGSYIEAYTRIGDFPRIALGISIMCLYVILFNKLLWQKLYQLAETRFSLN